MSGGLLLVHFFPIVFRMCALGGGCVVNLWFKADETETSHWTRSGVPTITTVIDGSVRARGAGRHFGPGNDPVASPPSAVDEESKGR